MNYSSEDFVEVGPWFSIAMRKGIFETYTNSKDAEQPAH